MGYPETFEGFAVHSTEKWSDFKRYEYKPKPLEDYDIDIKIHACGVCGSDLHTITGGWGDIEPPLVVGHEIVGEVLNTGSKVTTVKKGDRVGVGAQIWSCLECDNCKNHNENYCPKQVDTYGARFPDGTMAQGGYASHIRAHEYFTFKIPDAIPTPIAAPMLCAGLTTFSPLKRNNIGPGHKVAVMGLGGLGHFALMWISALGAESYVISHTPGKREDALKMGAKEFICTTEDKDYLDTYKGKFDMIINARDATDKDFKIDPFLSLLKVHGKFWNVGLPNGDWPGISPFAFASSGAMVGGSHIGNREECLEMLNLAAEKGVKTWVEEIPIGEEGCKQALERLQKSDVRYRFTLTGFDKAFKQ